MKVSVVIPAYNEEAVIEKNLRFLDGKCNEYFDDYEIVAVNDGSFDKTWEIIKKLCTDEHFVDAGYAGNRGKGAALKEGIEKCTGDIIVTTDCDLAYGTDVIQSAVGILSEKTEFGMLIGSRTISSDGFGSYPVIRRIASKAYFRLISGLARLKASDSQCGFKAYRQDCAKRLFSELATQGFAFDLEILMRASRAGIRVYEMPVKVINHGASKISVIRDSVKMLKDVARIRKIFKTEDKA